MRSPWLKASARDCCVLEAPIQFSKIGYDPSALKTFHKAVNQLTNASDVFIVNIVAFGLANLLKYDLLCGLRGNATQFLREASGTRADRRLRRLRPPSLQRRQTDLGGRILNLIDNGHQGEQFDIAGFRVIASAKVLTGLELLARAVTTASSIAEIITWGSIPFSRLRMSMVCGIGLVDIIPF
jgi:hypothetical protein